MSFLPGMFPGVSPQGSPVKAYVGSFNTSTGSVGTQFSVSWVPFRPQAVIFFWGGLLASDGDTVKRATAPRGIGFATGPSSRRCIGNILRDGQILSANLTGLRNNACVIIGTTTSFPGAFDLVQFEDDGFTLQVTSQLTTSYRVHFLALAGLENIDIGQYALPTSGSTVSVTTGFRPSTIFALTHGIANTSGPNNDISSGSIIVGVGTDGAGQFSVGDNATGSANPSSSSAFGTTSRGYRTPSGGIHGNFSMLSNGFQLSLTSGAAPGAYSHLYLALAGAKSAAGSFQSRTDSDNIVVSGLGFRPKAVIFASQRLTSDTGTSSSANTTINWSFGAASSPGNRAAVGTRYVHGTVPTNVGLAQNEAAVYVGINSSNALDSLLDLVSFDDDGFTCVMDDTDPSARHVFYLAIG